MELPKAIEHVLERRDLAPEAMRSVMRTILTGEATPAQIGGFLVGLRAKGETVDEVAAAAEVLRELAARVQVGAERLVDTCGTGGDGAKTFNISTAAAFVAAGAGARVAKHGNRSVSSRSGSADVLEALGVNLSITPLQARDCIERIGVGFLFAQNHHAAMRHALAVRRELGVRTLFNLLGPLTNPAGAPNQVVGVYSEAWVEGLAKVLQKLGARHVLVVHAADGLDEISIGAPTRVAELRDGCLTSYTVDPEQFGLARAPLSALTVADVAASAVMLRDVLSGVLGPARDIVLLNAGAAIYAAGVADSLRAGIQHAAESIASGAAMQKLNELVEFTQQCVGGEAVSPSPPSSGADILDRILARKREEIAERKDQVGVDALRSRIAKLDPPRGFVAAVRRRIADGRGAVIAEIKKASPSKGVIRADFDPEQLAISYARGGATCLSVLTDRDFFQGADEYLGLARNASGLPVLRKDFIIDPYQVYEARAIGADCILLIVAALTDQALRELSRLAQELGMDVLVEVHDRAELDRALPLKLPLLGINNRNLRTFDVTLQTTLDLLEAIPEDTVVVTESGIHTLDDVGLMRSHGVHTFLIGESFMKADDPGQKLAELFGAPRSFR